MKPIIPVFAKNLKLQRKLHGLSQNKLATELGLTRNKIASYESGSIEPSFSALTKICAFFGITIQDALTVSLSENPDVNVSGLRLRDSAHFIKIDLENYIQATEEAERFWESFKLASQLPGQTPPSDESKKLALVLEHLLATNWRLLRSLNE